VKQKKIAPTTSPTKKNNLFNDEYGIDFPTPKTTKPQVEKKTNNNLFNEDDDAPLITSKPTSIKPVAVPVQKQ
jgi:hypothetical protein